MNGSLTQKHITEDQCTHSCKYMIMYYTCLYCLSAGTFKISVWNNRTYLTFAAAPSDSQL